MTKTTTFLCALILSPLALAQGPAAPVAPGGPSGPGMAAPRPPAPNMHGGMHRGMEGPDARLLPPGTWWRNPDVVSRIGLAADQQKHIDQIFLDSRVQLVHMHASLEEEGLKLDSALQMTPFDQNAALAQINKIADTRADLEKANAKMLLTIRGVLSADQWTKLQAAEGPGGPPRGMGDGQRQDHRGGGGRGGRSIGPDGNGAPPPPGL